MVLPVTTNVDAYEQPFITDNAYIPDQLIAGVFPRVTQGQATVSTQSQVLARGFVMGQQTLGAATAVAGTNTGNGTISAVTLTGTAKLGTYNVLFTAATKFSVFDPTGREINSGSTGTAYATDLGFTITAGGTAFVAGDSFAITVAAGSGNYVPSIATATDGSQVPVAILANQTDATGGAANAGIYYTGEFNSNYIYFDSSWTVATLTPLLQKVNIYLKPSVSAADPS